MGIQREDTNAGGPILSCSQMENLIARHYADDWGPEVDLRRAAEEHLRECPVCYGKLIDLEIGFEAAMRAAAGGEECPDDMVVSDLGDSEEWA